MSTPPSANAASARLARTDVVGSLLRPPELLAAREAFGRGELTPAAFKAVEDAAVDWAIDLQVEAGLAVVTDGEMRRLSFQSQLTEAVDGFGDWDLDAFLWGDWRSDELGEKRVARPPIGVVGKLSRRRFLSAEEFTYARGRTRPGRQGDVAQPEPVCQLLGPGALADRLPAARGLPRRRRRDPAWRGRRARTAGRHVHAARRASLPPARRPGVSRVLREPRLAGRALGRPRCRARQPGHRPTIPT